MKITVNWLRERKACENHVEVFTHEWPQGCIVSLQTLLRAAELRLDLSWFAEKALTPEAQKVYMEACAEARKVYLEADAAVWKVYEEACAAALWQALKTQARKAKRSTP